MREKTDLSTYTYTSEGGRKSNLLLAYSRCWDELGKMIDMEVIIKQLGMEDDTPNFIEVQRELGNI